uniref:Retrovirus-related Pol polyprotein from transposon gypsy n=1 Tax=Bactrocera latifrons TaxID=174628 RepID=A0A0K8WJH6_BACLA
MNNKINKIVKQCNICKTNKYDRHPNKPVLKETPIPSYAGHIVHIDIYKTEGNLVLTAVDKFSKYAQVKPIKSKATQDIKEPLREFLFQFGVPKTVIFDNERAFNSATITFVLEDILNIKIFKSPPYKSAVNGQIETFHSTLSEIMRCLKAENRDQSFTQLLDRAVYEYNYSIHSTINNRPIEILFGRTVSTDPEQFEKARVDNIQRVKDKQQQDLKNHDSKLQPIIDYNPGETIYVKVHNRLGTKISPRYKKEVVKENRSTTVLTESNRVVHKSNIKS